MKLKNRRIITMIQWNLVLLALLIIMYFEVGTLFYIIAGLTILVVTVLLYSISNDEKTIMVSCDVDKYLKEIGRSASKRRNAVYPLKKAFGLIHKNQVEEAKECMGDFDFSQLEKPQKVYPIYIMTKTRLYFESQSVEELEFLVEELRDSSNQSENLLEYVKAYLSILKDDKLTAIESVKKAIPKQLHRLEIYELEYQLAKLYLETKQYKDSAFVADFIAKKKFKVIYIRWCKEISREAKEHLE